MRAPALISLILVMAPAACLGQTISEVTVEIPPSAGFMVNDVSATTASSPFTIRLSNFKLRGPSRSIRIGVKAMSAAFTPPGGPAIPSSLVFWTTGAPQNGVGSSGALTHTSFTAVFSTAHNAKNAAVTIHWNLAAPGPKIRAGVHTLTVNWRIEAL